GHRLEETCVATRGRALHLSLVHEASWRSPCSPLTTFWCGRMALPVVGVKAPPASFAISVRTSPGAQSPSSARRRSRKRRCGSCRVRLRARSYDSRAAPVFPSLRHTSARAEGGGG